MSKAAPLATPVTVTAKKGKRVAYLIAVHQTDRAVRVYAVMAVSAALALAQVTALSADALKVEVVGSLSRNLARRLGLRLGELRPI